MAAQDLDVLAGDAVAIELGDDGFELVSDPFGGGLELLLLLLLLLLRLLLLPLKLLLPPYILLFILTLLNDEKYVNIAWDGKGDKYMKIPAESELGKAGCYIQNTPRARCIEKRKKNDLLFTTGFRVTFAR